MEESYNYNILYLLTTHDGFFCDQGKEKVEEENKKMCRARGKSRAHEDQNNVIFFTSPYLHFFNDK